MEILLEESTNSLNPTQTIALDLMLNWFYSKPSENIKDYYFLLEGYAGTGKSFLMSKFLDKIQAEEMPQYNINSFIYKEKYYKMALTAPTHSALQVIKDYTKLNGCTIQNLLGLRPDVNIEDFDPNKPQFKKQKQSYFEKFDNLKLVIVDEASMLSEKLFDYLIENAKNYKYKMIFIGDSAQLPPINEDIGKVFKEAEHKYTLTEVMRTSKQGIKDACFELRVNKDKLKNINIAKFCDDSFIFTRDINKFCIFILQTNALVLCYTNDKVSQWNKALKDIKTGDETDFPLLVGDKIIAYKSINRNGEQLIMNSQRANVIAISEQIENNYYLDDIIPHYKVTLEDSVSKMELSTLKVVKKSGLDIYLRCYVEIYQKFKNANTSEKQQRYEEFEIFMNEYQIHKDLYNSENNKLIFKKHLDFAYSLTIHKSQGISIDYVAVDYGNILSHFYNPHTRNLAYVALTRAKQKVIVYQE